MSCIILPLYRSLIVLFALAEKALRRQLDVFTCVNAAKTLIYTFINKNTEWAIETITRSLTHSHLRMLLALIWQSEIHLRPHASHSARTIVHKYLSAHRNWFYFANQTEAYGWNEKLLLLLAISRTADTAVWSAWERSYIGKFIDVFKITQGQCKNADTLYISSLSTLKLAKYLFLYAPLCFYVCIPINSRETCEVFTHKFLLPARRRGRTDRERATKLTWKWKETQWMPLPQ